MPDFSRADFTEMEIRRKPRCPCFSREITALIVLPNRLFQKTGQLFGSRSFAGFPRFFYAFVPINFGFQRQRFER